MTPEEETAVRVIKEAYERWENRPPLRFEIPHMETYLLVIACQGMITHPSLPQSFAKALENLGRQFMERVADTPELYTLLELGWHREHDVAPDEPANIPVRREINGRWQTVMITRTEWEQNEGAQQQTDNSPRLDQLESVSGAPRMADGPGCTPVSVEDASLMYRAIKDSEEQPSTAPSGAQAEATEVCVLCSKPPHLATDHRYVAPVTPANCMRSGAEHLPHDWSTRRGDGRTYRCDGRPAGDYVKDPLHNTPGHGYPINPPTIPRLGGGE